MLGVGETLTFVMEDAHSLLLGVGTAHTYGLVDDDTHVLYSKVLVYTPLCWELFLLC